MSTPTAAQRRQARRLARRAHDNAELRLVTDAEPEREPEPTIDMWTIVRAIVSGAAGVAGAERGTALLAISAVEIAELLTSPDGPSESPTNKIADILAGIAPFELGRIVRARR